MPPVLLAAASLIGATALTRLLLRESRRVSDRLDAFRPRDPVPEEPGIVLEKDPVTGAYRPRRQT